MAYQERSYFTNAAEAFRVSVAILRGTNPLPTSYKMDGDLLPEDQEKKPVGPIISDRDKVLGPPDGPNVDEAPQKS